MQAFELMIRNRVLLRTVAAFFLLETVSSILTPAVSWALTAGPTAPEFTSFEPVDTTDMVNLSTGDFVYNMPLLEVPGPSGGYPLSLSYHAGIMPNEEASWVGLGFTMNPGAITRTVNGYADDDFGSVRTIADVNTGGEREKFSASIGLPFIGFGLSVADDSNLGVGVGVEAFGGVKAGGIGIGISAGKEPYSTRTHVGLSASYGSFSVGFSFDGENVAGSVSAFRSVGADISSQGITPSLSVAGASIRQHNTNVGKMNVNSEGITLPIPLGNSGLFLNLGYNYTRYYSYQSNTVSAIGSLYAKQSAGKDPDSWGMDSYAIFDPNKSGDFAIKNENPDKIGSGSYPFYDQFQVNAQGLNGTMQPYIFENGTLFRQNMKKDDGSYAIKYNKVNNSFNFNRQTSFRFNNDFSNSFTGTDDRMRIEESSFSFSGNGYSPAQDGWNDAEQQLAGSRNIEWFSNEQIKAGTAKNSGFIDYQAYNLRNVVSTVNYADPVNEDISKQCGGFMITNASGVTYHYALPVYEYGDYSKSFVKDKPEIYQTNISLRPYAYMWLLTAITGSDFVDRNANGMADDGDWGYWVSLEYGLWSSNYLWRNPGLGYHTDLDQNINFYSRGTKEIYYLDAIKTQSHVAVFEKDYRKDGKGLVQTGIDSDPRFTPVLPSGTFHETYLPTEQLRLRNIYLLTKEDYDALGGNTLKTSVDQNAACTDTYPTMGKVLHCNVFDQQDDLTTLKPKALRIIKFDHDQELQPGTPNSFDLETMTLSGKLTLKALHFLGRDGFDGIPPVKFTYAKNPSYNKDAYDIWKMYKSDYAPRSNDNLARYVSDASAEEVDAWSLTSIRTSLGANITIDYESDKYLKPVLYKSSMFNIADVQPTGEYGKMLVSFHGDLPDLNNYLTENSTVSIKGVIAYAFDVSGASLTTTCDGAMLGNPGEQFKSVKYDNLDVVAINTNTIEIYNESLYKDLTLIFGEHSRPATLPYPKANPAIPCQNTLGQEITINVTYNYEPYWDGGNLSFLNEGKTTYGGGLCVANIAVESMGARYITEYTYENGQTSYEPMGLDLDILVARDPKDFKGEPWQADIKRREVAVTDFLKNLQGDFSKLLSITREVPAPGVIYQYVTVAQKVQKAGQNHPVTLPGKRVFEFQVFEEKMIEATSQVSMENPYPTLCKNANGTPVACEGGDEIHGEPVNCWDQFGNPIGCGTPASISIAPFTLDNYSANVGALKSIASYGPDGKLMQKTTNNYLYDNTTSAEYKQQLKEQFNNQGVISQRFNENKMVDGTNKLIFSKKTEYPQVLLGQTVFDYKTGVETVSQNMAFDFYSGEPTSVQTRDAYDNVYISTTKPAYKVYQGMGLGLKGGRNMLTQQAYAETYKMDPADVSKKLALVSATAQTWSNQIPVLKPGESLAQASAQTGIWRKHATYAFIGNDQITLINGLYPADNVTIFSAWNRNDPVSEGWQKDSEVTLYNVSSHGLEAMDVNSQFAATKMTFDRTKVNATATNAAYSEFGYSSAEERPAGDLFGADVVQNSAVYAPMAHTGTRALSVQPGARAFTFSIAPKRRTYHVSVWSSLPAAAFKYKLDNNTENTAALNVRGRAGNWYLLEADIPVTQSFNKAEIWCEANGAVTYFDDFRVHPLDAAMTSYVYNAWGELSHILDNNNLYTEYRYDEMGRLKTTHRETFQLVYGNDGVAKTAEVLYHYGTETPFTVDIQAYKGGTSGTLAPAGTVTLPQGASQSFAIGETCSSPKLLRILIDGKAIDLTAANTTLWDGTQIRYASGTLQMNNIQSPHTLRAEFLTSPGGGGGVSCHYNDNGCVNGNFDYYIIDNCGDKVNRINRPFDSIPEELRPAVEPTCSNAPGAECGVRD